MKMNKTVALVLALTLVLGVAVGGTLAWLTAESGTVENTFSPSNIHIKLEETGTTTDNGKETKSFDMVPGWIIDKDPKVTVEAGSEDCWLFVEITESNNLDSYIAYAINDPYNAETNPAGWRIVQAETNGVTVIGRKVYQDDETKSFSILGAGSFEENINNVKYTVSWNVDQVGVKPSVTEADMEAIANNQPTLTFQAYAVQLYKANSDGDKSNTNDEFEIDVAWSMAQAQTSGN